MRRGATDTSAETAAGLDEINPVRPIQMEAPRGRTPRLPWPRRGRGGLTSGILLFYVAVLIFFSLVSASFPTYSNAVNIVSTASLGLVVALGQALVIISGGFDLSVGGVVPMGAVLFSRLAGGGMSVMSAMVVVLAVGAMVGLANAVLVAYMRINPLITTLGTLSVTGGIAYTIAGGITVILPNRAAGLGNVAVGTIPFFVFLALGLSIATHVLLKQSTFGRRVYSVGGNPDAARLAGVRVELVQCGVYMLSGVFAAVGGIIGASQVLAATGGTGSDTTLTSIAAVVLGGAALTGGTGGIPGTVLGVLILETVADGMNILRIPAFYQQMVTGLVLLGAVALGLGWGRIQALLRVRR